MPCLYENHKAEKAHYFIFKSSSSCTYLLVSVPSAPITIGITVTFIFLQILFQMLCWRVWEITVLAVLNSASKRRNDYRISDFNLKGKEQPRH